MKRPYSVFELIIAAGEAADLDCYRRSVSSIHKPSQCHNGMCCR